MKEAPSLRASETIGPRQREQETKKEEQKLRNKFKVYGLISLFVKVNLVFAGVALWKMPLIAGLPLHQVVGTTIFAVLAHWELKPYWRLAGNVGSARKAKQPNNMAEAGLEFIET